MKRKVESGAPLLVAALVFLFAAGSAAAQSGFSWPEPARATDGTILVPSRGRLVRADNVSSGICSAASDSNVRDEAGVWAIERSIFYHAETSNDDPERNEKVYDWWIRSMPYINCYDRVYGGYDGGSPVNLMAHRTYTRAIVWLLRKYDLPKEAFLYECPRTGLDLFAWLDARVADATDSPFLDEDRWIEARRLLRRVFAREWERPSARFTDIYHAAKARDHERMRALLRSGADPDGEGSHGHSAFSVAAWYGDTTGAGILLGAGADLEAANDDGNTPLHIAAKRGQNRMVSLLTERGADVNSTNGFGLTPLMVAVESENGTAVSRLLAAGADVDRTDEDGRTALHHLLHHNSSFHPVILESLLDAGADPNARDEDLETPFQHAVEHALLETHQHDDYMEQLRMLVAAGADLNAPVGDGAYRTYPIIRAAFFGPPEALRYFIDRGASVHVRDGSGQTAMYSAVSMVDMEKFNILLDAGARVDVADDCDVTLVHYATGSGRTDVRAQMIRIMASRGADLSVRANSDGACMIIRQETPLEQARRLESRELVALLRSLGAR